MAETSYTERRAEIEHYFDRTAVDAWSKLTTSAPVSRIRQTVREGRDEMRLRLLNWLPENLEGLRILDAGCGTGALAVDCALRGANVIAIDVAGNLVNVARERSAELDLKGSIDFRVGDMLADAPANVDYVVAMDSLIHYADVDVQKVIEDFARRANKGVLFTAAPWTPALALMHFVGRRMPNKSNKAPAIEPVRINRLVNLLDRDLADSGWKVDRHERIKNGFYISQALELVKE